MIRLIVRQFPWRYRILLGNNTSIDRRQVPKTKTLSSLWWNSSAIISSTPPPVEIQYPSSYVPHHLGLQRGSIGCLKNIGFNPIPRRLVSLYAEELLSVPEFPPEIGRNRDCQYRVPTSLPFHGARRKIHRKKVARFMKFRAGPICVTAPFDAPSFQVRNVFIAKLCHLRDVNDCPVAST